MLTPTLSTGEPTVARLNIDRETPDVKRIFATLALEPGESVVEMNGKPVVRVLPAADPPAPDHGPWTPETNHRRCDLVDKKFATGLTAAEAKELESLTLGMRRYVERVAPVPLDEVRRQHQRLLEVAAESDRRT